MSYLMPNPSLLWYYFTIGRISKFISFRFNLEVNVIAQEEFELAYYDVAVHHISNYTMGTHQNLTLCHILIMVEGLGKYILEINYLLKIIIISYLKWSNCLQIIIVREEYLI